VSPSEVLAHGVHTLEPVDPEWVIPGALLLNRTMDLDIRIRDKAKALATMIPMHKLTNWVLEAHNNKHHHHHHNGVVVKCGECQVDKEVEVEAVAVVEAEVEVVLLLLVRDRAKMYEFTRSAQLIDVIH